LDQVAIFLQLDLHDALFDFRVPLVHFDVVFKNGGGGFGLGQHQLRFEAIGVVFVYQLPDVVFRFEQPVEALTCDLFLPDELYDHSMVGGLVSVD
jgi:hypothetical protein